MLLRQNANIFRTALTVPSRPYPPDYGFGLAGVYAVWLLVVIALYPVCRWFAEVKQRRRSVWLSYL
jgi:hypothetical protein